MSTAVACELTIPEAPSEELRRRAWEAREALGDQLIVLGHHYQKDEVIEFADVTGDSFKLAKLGAEAEAELVLFLGVYFMAESADVLARPGQTVVLPDLSAGCHLAECADIYTVRDAWEQISGALPGKRIIPLTYMNSDAVLKAFCGENGGAVCTSGNARTVFEWALAEGDAIFFFPDEHLGRNIACDMGFEDASLPVWNPRLAELGGARRELLADAPVILWKGFCNVHTNFTAEQVERHREDHPGVRVIVHPECPRPTVLAADESGSTEYIIRRCDELPAGSTISIGTDLNLVYRLRDAHPAKTIFPVLDTICPCVTMNRIDLPKLTGCLEALESGGLPNVVSVDEEVAEWARVALDRMLALG
ncbi:MAG: quinolinate synthase NadA [Thermoleophilia bacterium]|nr:quinolinate synthase NadA [Thermoleophilia bacterium]